MKENEKHMTINEFIERLRQTPRDWFCGGGFCGGDRWIRRPGEQRQTRCPIVVVANYAGPSSNYPRAAKLLGLSVNDANLIAAAADNFLKNDPQRIAMRKRLLEACGLVEATVEDA